MSTYENRVTQTVYINDTQKRLTTSGGLIIQKLHERLTCSNFSQDAIYYEWDISWNPDTHWVKDDSDHHKYSYELVEKKGNFIEKNLDTMKTTLQTACRSYLEKTNGNAVFSFFNAIYCRNDYKRASFYLNNLSTDASSQNIALCIGSLLGSDSANLAQDFMKLLNEELETSVAKQELQENSQAYLIESALPREEIVHVARYVEQQRSCYREIRQMQVDAKRYTEPHTQTATSQI